ncbi:MAG: hypothetical protein ACYTAN_14550 [Planctomycetota bacterium]|jgi:hypothetical protein
MVILICVLCTLAATEPSRPYPTPFQHFRRCLAHSGPGRAATFQEQCGVCSWASCVERWDTDGDGDIDLRDYAALTE